jgi:CheY-like chemotaxis protein
MIRRNVDLEARLIDDLLDTTRIASGKLRLNRQPTDVHEVLRYAVDTCKPDAEAKGVVIEVRAEAAEHRASADAARLEQVFWNLIKNAIKFTPAGGTITVRSRNETPADGLAALSAGPALVIDVTDTGIGIPAENLRHIFRPFEQGDPGITRQFGGLGLGLAISKSLAESHGGSLTASSPGPHQGSTFTVTLPTLRAPAGVPAEAPAGPEGEARHPPLRILLVEDHADTARLLARILRARGHTVTTAGSVAEALAASAGAGAPFDLVISDLGLPDGSGVEVMRRLRSTQPNPPRGVAVSGYGTDADKQMTREAGFEAHLTKPIKVADLDAVLHDAAAAR